MEEDLVEKKTAKLARQAGFSEKCYWYLCPQGRFRNKTELDWNSINVPYEHSSLPTQSLLQKWLREVHGIEVIPSPSFKRKSYGCEVYHYTEKNETGYVPIELGSFKTYEEALEEGVQEALKLI